MRIKLQVLGITLGTEMKRKSNNVISIQVKGTLMLFHGAHYRLSDGLRVLFLELVVTTVVYVLLCYIAVG